MSKLRLLSAVISVSAFLASLWAVPIACVTCGLFVVKTFWMQIALCLMAAVWLLLLRPWTMFKDPKWNRFIADMRCAINALLTNWK